MHFTYVNLYVRTLPLEAQLSLLVTQWASLLFLVKRHTTP